MYVVEIKEKNGGEKGRRDQYLFLPLLLINQCSKKIIYPQIRHRMWFVWKKGWKGTSTVVLGPGV